MVGNVQEQGEGLQIYFKVSIVFHCEITPKDNAFSELSDKSLLQT